MPGARSKYVNSRKGDRVADVAVVVVNYRTPGLAMNCLAALAVERQQLPNLKVVMVDGGSGDGSAAELSAGIAGPAYQGWVSFLPLPINGGFGWANNQAIQQLLARADAPNFIHLLNPDTEIESGGVKALVDYLEANPRVAAVGSQLLEPDGSWTGSAFNFPTVRGEVARGARTGTVDRVLHVPPPVVATASEATEVDWATGASVMFRVDALREVGLFDEGFSSTMKKSSSMWRLRKAGWTIAFEPRSRVRHVGGGSSGVHSRETTDRLLPRRPPYWYRSRSRYFALTRGSSTAFLAFFSWMLGHAIWSVRRMAGAAPEAKPFDHQLRDHLSKAFPRKHDSVPAPVSVAETPSASPAWMQNRWL